MHEPSDEFLREISLSSFEIHYAYHALYTTFQNGAVRTAFDTTPFTMDVVHTLEQAFMAVDLNDLGPDSLNSQMLAQGIARLEQAAIRDDRLLGNYRSSKKFVDDSFYNHKCRFSTLFMGTLLKLARRQERAGDMDAVRQIHEIYRNHYNPYEFYCTSRTQDEMREYHLRMFRQHHMLPSPTQAFGKKKTSTKMSRRRGFVMYQHSHSFF